MQVHHEPSMRAGKSPRSLGQLIRDEEMRRVTRILNTRTSRRRELSFVERYRGSRYDTGIVPVPTQSTVRSRLKSLLL